MVKEKVSQMRELSVIGNRSTTNGRDGYVGNTKGDPSDDLTVSGKPDPPVC